MKHTDSRKDSETVTHSEPAVFVQVPDIGYGTPGIEIHCNKTSHKTCLDDLRKAIKSGGRVLPRTDAWRELVKKVTRDY